MSFKEECLPYIKQYPLISNQIGQDPDGNAILYCGVAMAIKDLYEDPDDGDWLWVASIYRECQKEVGLLTRGPHKKEDFQTHDDYVGMCYLSARTNFMIAKSIVDYGKKHNWAYDNVGENSKTLFGWLACWHRRFAGQVEHYKICATDKLNIFEQIWWSLGFLTIGKMTESGTQLRWLKLRAYQASPNKYWFCDKAAALWQNKIIKRYPNLMGDVFAIYYGKDHVFTRWTQGRL